MSDTVKVDLNWTLSYKGETHGPGKDLTVSRQYATGLGLEIKGEGEKPSPKAKSQKKEDPETDIRSNDFNPDDFSVEGLEELYQDAVEKDLVREIPPGAGSGKNGRVIREDLEAVLLGRFDYPEE